MDINQVFDYHRPKPESVPKFNAITVALKNAAQAVVDNCPESPERTLALRDLQRARMMANAAIALYTKQETS